MGKKLGSFDSLLIVGNGFDCSLNAKTKYEDFYNFLVKGFHSTSFRKFINELGDGYRADELEIFYNSIKEEAKTNYFVNYFVLYNKSFDCWVDFESELGKIITGFDYLLTVLKDTDKFLYNGHGVFIKINANVNLLSVIENYPDNRFFSSEITNKEYYSFLINGAEITDYKSLYKEIELFIQSFPKALYKDLTSFSRLFAIYLSLVKNNASYNVDHPFIEECRVAINYNYTDFLLHYCKRKDCELEKIIYINGECDYLKHTDRIVFGIDSSLPIKNDEFFVFTKTAQRTIKNTEINKIASMLTNYFFKKIVVYGHSLSVADKDSLNYILTNCVGLDVGRVGIEVYCYNEESKLSIVSNLKVILGIELYTELQINNRLVLIDAKNGSIN